MATTRTVLRLRREMVDAVSRRAEASGQTLDAVMAELLAEGLPTVLAEASAIGLRASLSRAEPVEAQVVEHPSETKNAAKVAPRSAPGVKTRGPVTRMLPDAGHRITPPSGKHCDAVG
jgi:hypothetical protein